MEREQKLAELGQEAANLGKTENWIGRYAAAHEMTMETTLGEFLTRAQQKIRITRESPEPGLSDLRQVTVLNHALPKEKRIPPTMEVALAPENTHEDLSEGALDIELGENMTIAEVVEVIRAKKQELIEEAKSKQ